MVFAVEDDNTTHKRIGFQVLKDGLSTLHAPYAYGFAIILLTVLVKAATFPLTKKQVESAMAMRSLQPQIKAIQQRYAGDQERIQLETARLYKLAGINPLAGCLPTLATIPVWIGLYRALSNVADEKVSSGYLLLLVQQRLLLVKMEVDGHPPLGWSDTLAYLVLPVLLVVSQYISVQIMQSSQPNDPNMKSSQAITKLLPLMIGYFALSVPSGLSLYWLTNNILSTAQQVWLQKLGGAKNPVVQIQDDIMKDDQMKIPKSVPKVNSTKTEARQDEKSTSGGPQPGERFRQLKEQEARRRQQREEEKGKATEAASKATKVYETNEITVEKGNQDGGDNVENSQHVNADADPSTSQVTVNGNPLSKDLEENQNSTYTPQRESNEGSPFNNGVNEKSDEEPREAFTTTATTKKQHPEEESDHLAKD
ncbi:hypothetical protein Ahy_B10g101757 isoform C [Arachis hypogaea]|uniref:Membrane insertase YidC/Oxa/ALB C-terminal domain-containing protein n=1 Tax=Arachis hypogaea TaxID=3818 RepID=A0A444X0A2_ARAHY|nr:hypothetical protein Ahy_B10g101757 isoform C [Arachis hypogaea]